VQVGKVAMVVVVGSAYVVIVTVLLIGLTEMQEQALERRIERGVEVAVADKQLVVLLRRDWNIYRVGIEMWYEKDRQELELMLLKEQTWKFRRQCFENLLAEGQRAVDINTYMVGVTVMIVVACR
jgi:hypothetical protein